MSLTATDARAFADCIAAEGVALFPADTVYGLAAAPDSGRAVRRLYELKGRDPDQPAAVMFFGLEPALRELGADLDARVRSALGALLPGPVTVLVANPARRWPLACGPAPDRLGIRVPALPSALAALVDMEFPVLQSSANLHGGPDARRLADVDPAIRAGADVEFDGGELPGRPSTVVDLTAWPEGGDLRILREGALPVADIRRLIGTVADQWPN